MLADSLTDTVYFSDLLPVRFPRLAAELTRILAAGGVSVSFISGTKDIWCRDYMPVQAGPGRFVKFRYYPDYLRGRCEYLITPPKVTTALPIIKKCHRSRLIVDGGNIVRYGGTAIMTDKVFSENPQYTPGALRTKLTDLLEVEKLVIIPREPHELFGHADGIVRFVDERTVVANDYSKVNPAFGIRLKRALRAEGLAAIDVPYAPRRSNRGKEQSAAGVYVNFLQTNRRLLVPGCGTPNDDKALAVLAALFRKDRVSLVDCRELSIEGGGLNCISWC